MSHQAREAKTGVECFKEEQEGVEERRGFCLVEWFTKKKMLSVAGGGYLFIYFIYIYIIIIYLFIYINIYIIFLIRVANLHTYTISNMQYFNTIITGKKVQKKN